jgi:hypothetical protein
MTTSAFASSPLETATIFAPLDQRGIAERFISQGQIHQAAPFGYVTLDISDLPTRHNYYLALWQNPIERTLADWVVELGVPIYRGRDVTGFAQDDTGVDVELSDGGAVRAQYLVGCDGGRSLICKRAGIDFPGWDASVSYFLARGTRCSGDACPISTCSPRAAHAGCSPCCTRPGRYCSSSVSSVPSTWLRGRRGSNGSTPDMLARGSCRCSAWWLLPAPC